MLRAVSVRSANASETLEEVHHRIGANMCEDVRSSVYERDLRMIQRHPSCLFSRSKRLFVGTRFARDVGGLFVSLDNVGSEATDAEQFRS